MAEEKYLTRREFIAAMAAVGGSIAVAAALSEIGDLRELIERELALELPDVVREAEGHTLEGTHHWAMLIDLRKCIGCQYCVMACPYGVRYFNQEERVVEKCTSCAHLLADGKEPACVAACCSKCRIFGDLDDPNSNVSQALQAAGSSNVHTLTDVGNHPSVKYILHRKTATWRSS